MNKLLIIPLFFTFSTVLSGYSTKVDIDAKDNTLYLKKMTVHSGKNYFISVQ